MCSANEPMICIHGEFGVRLREAFYMTEGRPRWFLQPYRSVPDPLGHEV